MNDIHHEIEQKLNNIKKEQIIMDLLESVYLEYEEMEEIEELFRKGKVDEIMSMFLMKIKTMAH
jgi:hypothetical protein